MIKKIDFEDFGFSLSSTGVVIYEKKRLLFSANQHFISELNEKTISNELRQEFADKKLKLSSDALVEKIDDDTYQIRDKQQVYIIKNEKDKLNIYKKRTHVTFCVNKDNLLDAHITDEKADERESTIFKISLDLYKEFIETDFQQFILQLLQRCSVTEWWVMNSSFLFLPIIGDNVFLEFFEKRRGAYRPKDNISVRLRRPGELEDGGYIAYTYNTILKGVLILHRPQILFIPIEKIDSISCLVEEFLFQNHT